MECIQNSVYFHTLFVEATTKKYQIHMCSKIKNKHKMLVFDFLHLNITLKWPSFSHYTETSLLRLLWDESLDDFTMKSPCDFRVTASRRLYCKVTMRNVCWRASKWQRNQVTWWLVTEKCFSWRHSRVSVTWKSSCNFIVTLFYDTSEFNIFDFTMEYPNYFHIRITRGFHSVVTKWLIPNQ